MLPKLPIIRAGRIEHVLFAQWMLSLGLLGENVANSVNQLNQLILLSNHFFAFLPSGCTHGRLCFLLYISNKSSYIISANVHSLGYMANHSFRVNTTPFS